jgi:type II restriction enzyme
MQFEDLLQMYERMRDRYGTNTYNHISELLKEAKQIHKKDFLERPSVKRMLQDERIPDHEQSWRSFKGQNLEKLIMAIIKDEVESLKLRIIGGNTLETTNSSNLPKDLNLIKRNLLIDYGEFGAYLPDVDLIIYDPLSCKIVAVISSKVTLRERIAQTSYWKIKLGSDEVTKHIKVFFVTPDEDGTLTMRNPAKKGRAIVEIDTDGGYVMTEKNLEESSKVKKFDRFIDDLRQLIDGSPTS